MFWAARTSRRGRCVGGSSSMKKRRPALLLATFGIVAGPHDTAATAVCYSRLAAHSFPALPFPAAAAVEQTRIISSLESPMERTFIAIKPDGVQRALVSDIMGRFERRGYKLVGLKFMVPTRELLERHYAEHVGKPFFEGLVGFMSSGPVVASVWEGHDVIAQARRIMGATNPSKAEIGTIRGDFAISGQKNLVHGSDSAESAKREIALWFRDHELSASWTSIANKYTSA